MASESFMFCFIMRVGGCCDCCARMCRLGLTFCGCAARSCGMDALTRLPWICREPPFGAPTALTAVCVSLSTLRGRDVTPDAAASSGIDGNGAALLDMPDELELCSEGGGACNENMMHLNAKHETGAIFGQLTGARMGAASGDVGLLAQFSIWFKFPELLCDTADDDEDAELMALCDPESTPESDEYDLPRCDELPRRLSSRGGGAGCAWRRAGVEALLRLGVVDW